MTPFPTIVFVPKQLHINDLELLSIVLCIELRRAPFPCSRKHLILMMFGSKGPGARAHGPRPIFLNVLEIHFMVRDLSRSVPKVFRSPGKPLIKWFHFTFNSKCHFSKVSVFIQLPIELAIVLPCYSLVGSIGPVIPLWLIALLDCL